MRRPGRGCGKRRLARHVAGSHGDVGQELLDDAAGGAQDGARERGRYDALAVRDGPPQRGERVREGLADVDDAEAVAPDVVGRVQGVLDVERVEPDAVHDRRLPSAEAAPGAQEVVVRLAVLGTGRTGRRAA